MTKSDIDFKMVEMIKEKLNTKDTQELTEIYQQHDRGRWSNETFEAIRQLLLIRGEDIPTEPQSEPEFVSVLVPKATILCPNCGAQTSNIEHFNFWGKKISNHCEVCGHKWFCDPNENLPLWGKIVIVINLVMALLSFALTLPVIGTCVKTQFYVPDEFKPMVIGAFVGAILAVLSLFGLNKACKGNSRWLLATTIMLIFFLVLSFSALFAPGSPKVKIFFFIDFPVRLISWGGLVALVVKQRRGRTTA